MTFRGKQRNTMGETMDACLSCKNIIQFWWFMRKYRAYMKSLGKSPQIADENISFGIDYYGNPDSAKFQKWLKVVGR